MEKNVCSAINRKDSLAGQRILRRWYHQVWHKKIHVLPPREPLLRAPLLAGAPFRTWWYQTPPAEKTLQNSH
jgi:hypothetical protein